MDKNDIFISYRRQGGKDTAKHICDLLTRDNYNVAFDIDTLRSGLFDENIYKIIDQCTDVIVILSNGSLSRCCNQDDWVRLEIAYAIKKRKNIIPIELAGFIIDKEFQDLPQDIGKLRLYNTIKKNDEYFDAFYNRLKKDYIKSTPIIHKETTKRKSTINWGALLIMFLIMGAVAFGSYQIEKENQRAESEYREELEREEQYEREKEEKYIECLDNLSGAFQIITEAYGRVGVSFQLTNLNNFSIEDIKFRIKSTNDEELYSELITIMMSGGRMDIGFCRFYNWNWEKGQIAEITLSNGMKKSWTYK